MKQVFFLLFTMVMVLSLFSLSNQNSQESSLSGEQNESQTDEPYLFFEGVVSPSQELKMKTSNQGKVVEVHAVSGDRVKSGQLLIVLRKVDSEKEIRKAEDYVKIWEKTLFNRQHWRVRSGAAESQAERKIKQAKESLAKTRQKYADIKIYSLLSGTVGFIVDKGKLVEEDSVVVEILDESILTTSFSSDSEIVSKHIDNFQDGDEIPITFKEVQGEFSGKVKKVGKTINIAIPNPDFVLTAGMRARFRLKKSYVLSKPLPKKEPARTKTATVSLEKREKGTVKEMSGRSEFKVKKIEYEFSLGLSLNFSDELYYRESAIDTLIEQYALNYGINHTASGAFSKNVMFFPVQALVNYHLKKNIFLKGGLEYGFGSNSEQNFYRLTWPGFTENQDYSLTNKMSYVMPFVGGEIRFSSFGIYTHLGLNFFSFNHEQISDYSDATYQSKREDSVKASGTGFGILLGGKYRIKLKKKINLLLKIELSYLSIGSLSGSRDTSITDSDGASFSESVDGTIYGYEMNPFSQEWFYNWELSASTPSESWLRNVSKLKINLYSIRILFGIVF